MLILTLPVASRAAAEKSAPATDTLVLANGDTLHGTLVNAGAGSVTFHTEAFGDLTTKWENVKELHAPERFGVLQKSVKLSRKHVLAQIQSGSLDLADGSITLHPPAGAAAATIPLSDTEYIADYGVLDNQINHEPRFISGWNGSATAGATLVKATQNQYTVAGALALVRSVPSVAWLPPRNRSEFGFSGSYGKITQPGATTVKSAIYHVDGERDEYMSSHLFALAQFAFDHNYALNLQLQQIYGGGLGWTLFSTPRHEADLKATVQYEKQQFIQGGAGGNQNLIGSTLAASYMLHTKLFVYTQGVEFIPAFNNPHAYSASETDTLAFPAYKRFSFSMGTIDSYLNNPPAVVPPTKRNSFQFTMGLTYAIKSKY